MKNPHRALEAINIITGGDFGLDVEWWLTDKRIKHKDKMKMAMAELITKIYMIAHAEGKCNAHNNWEQIKYDILKKQDNF
jgi:hypothetical protein